MSHVWVPKAPAPSPCTGPPSHGGGPSQRTRRSPRATTRSRSRQESGSSEERRVASVRPGRAGQWAFRFRDAVELSPALAVAPASGSPASFRTLVFGVRKASE